MQSPQITTKKVRRMIIFFVIILALSGITAFPVHTELKWAIEHQIVPANTAMGEWLGRVWQGVQAMQEQYPFLFYGYDWLAFAHLVIALAFIGPYKDPVRNKWIIEWAMLACLSVLPLAIIAGPIRGIPWFHILVDCSFGIIGLLPLWITRRWIIQLEKQDRSAGN